jgi:predicted dehydrogenase
MLSNGANRRFDPDFHKLGSIVAEGKIGIPEFLRITGRDLRHCLS